MIVVVDTSQALHVSRSVLRRSHRESGVVAILFVAALLVTIAFFGLALDLSRVYNRKMEMQTVADTAAVAAALELDGTSAGIGRAVQRASERFTAAAPTALTFSYGNEHMNWSNSAIEFGTTSAGPWLASDAAAARAVPNGLLYAKVDTAALDSTYGQIQTIFVPVISKKLTIVSTSTRAIAGRSGIAVTPIGICAMRAGADAIRNRNGELEEYGFRRGVSYDLMQLNPNATNKPISFLIDPMTAPGATGGSSTDLNTVASFICTGTMGVARVTGGKVSVSSPFPLGSLYTQLNSRFDSYATPCSADSAPPDTNIKAYPVSTSGTPWMNTVPSGQAAATSLVDSKLWTVAGPDPTPAGTTGVQFGPLWAYAKAAKYADPAPAAGYSSYGTADWTTLYNPGQPKAAASYPSTTPYAAGGTNGKAPTHKGLAGRRVLNVGLLACPVSGASAAILGIGRFFMTVPADDTHLYAEFAGLIDEQTLRVQVKLYP